MANLVLTGTEVLQVQPIAGNGRLSGQTGQTTTAAIAALANLVGGQEILETSITTVGAGVLTAAALVGGQIARSGPTGNYTDTTDTAVAIVAALPSYQANQTFFIRIKNATAFTQTLAAGAGVTLPATVLIPAFNFGLYFATVTSATAVTLTHMGTVPIVSSVFDTVPAISTLSTVGAGTILAAYFPGFIINRTGSQSGTAFTDTTDTAAAIISACPNLINKVGTAMIVEYANSTNATATITGGNGVTVSGVSVIPPNTISQFLVTYTAAATLTMIGLGVTQNIATSVNVLGSSTGSNSIVTANAGTSNYVSTLPAATGNIAYSNPAPVAAGATLAVTAAMVGAPILLNTAAGSVATLPAATGTGNTYKFFVTTTITSNSHKILAASVSDFLNGISVGHVAAGTTLSFSAAAATAHSIQMPSAGTTPSGGTIGDWYEFTDVAANLWDVKGAYLSGTTSTTPFSASTT